MKCRDCGREWTAGGRNSVSGTCPYCGRKLFSGARGQSFEEALREIAEVGGEEILGNSQLLLAFLSDIAPERQKEKRLLQIFLQCDGNTVLLGDRKKSRSLSAASEGRIVSRMENNYFVSAENAQNMVRMFWLAIGGTVQSATTVNGGNSAGSRTPSGGNRFGGSATHPSGTSGNGGNKAAASAAKPNNHHLLYAAVGVVLCLGLFFALRSCGGGSAASVTPTYVSGASESEPEIGWDPVTEDYEPYYEEPEAVEAVEEPYDPYLTVTGNVIQGEFTYEDETDLYRFTAPTSGIYRFDFATSDVTELYYFTLIGPDNGVIKYTTSSYEGFNTELEAGKTYAIQIEEDGGLLQYTVTIGIPKETEEITGTQIASSIRYDGQEDHYTYRAPVSGRYYFQFDVSNVEYAFQFRLKDARNETLARSSSYYDGQSADLEAGEVYTIVIEQYNGTLDYTVEIGVPQEIQTVSNNRISGTIRFEEQQDQYLYTAPETGQYYIAFETSDANSSFSLRMRDAKNNSLLNSTSYYDGETVDLTAGDTYSIVISQYNGQMDYEVTIHVPQAQKKVTGSSIQGSMDFPSKRDVYIYTAPSTGRYTFTMDCSNANAIYQVRMWDSRNNTVLNTMSYYSQDTADLTAGETYTIWVEQYDGYPNYTITIR